MAIIPIGFLGIHQFSLDFRSYILIGLFQLWCGKPEKADKTEKKLVLEN
jgi:hypothetical protein